MMIQRAGRLRLAPSILTETNRFAVRGLLRNIAQLSEEVQERHAERAEGVSHDL